MILRHGSDCAFPSGAYIDLADRLDDLEQAAKNNPPQEPEPIHNRSLLEDEENEAA